MHQTTRSTRDSRRDGCEQPLDFKKALTTEQSHRGKSLLELSMARPVLVVFLRHCGCTFAREALADLAAHSQEISNKNVDIAVVQMESDTSQVHVSQKLTAAHRIINPNGSLYRAFGLRRGFFWQLTGPKIWWRGFQAAILRGHGFGRIRSDGFQMPGVFLLNRGEIVNSFRHRTAADRPDYLDLACCHGHHR